jgi:hypothetical protein
MCQRIQCSTCGKPTFAGCGRHVEQVLGDVKPEDRCQGHSKAEKNDSKDGFFKKLFGG